MLVSSLVWSGLIQHLLLQALPQPVHPCPRRRLGALRRLGHQGGVPAPAHASGGDQDPLLGGGGQGGGQVELQVQVLPLCPGVQQDAQGPRLPAQPVRGEVRYQLSRLLQNAYVFKKPFIAMDS